MQNLNNMLKELNEKEIGKYINLEKWGLSTFELKILAILAMFIDHFSIIFLENNNNTLYLTGRAIGRICFPIICFVLVEGFFHTKDRMKHGIILGIFALLSEVPYDLMYGSLWDLTRQNVLITLFIGYMMIWMLDLISKFRISYPDKVLQKIGAARLNTLLELVVMLVGFAMAYFINCSYSYAGIMIILCFYVFRKHHISQGIVNIVFNMGMYPLSIQWFGALSIIPIELYNDTPGKHKWKYFFYLFYPLHIVIFVGIKIFLIK